jgi:hypothetical protein
MNALLKAIRDMPGHREMLTWQLLSILDEQQSPVSFEFIYRVFNKCQQTNSNYRYYAALDRLIARKQIKLEYNKRGWRLWSITPEGRQAVAHLNTEALKYLCD